MSKKPAKSAKRVLDAALKASFEAKAREAAPAHLVDLAHELDQPAPPRKTKTG